MADKPETKMPPYVGYVTFTNFLSGLASSGVPARIDNSLMRSQSGGTQSSLLGTLRYLNMIRKDGTPTARLTQWVGANEAGRKTLMWETLHESYPFLAHRSLDLGTATPQLFDEALRTAGASSGTLEKARGFFLAAAKDAGLAVSNHIGRGRQSTPGNGTPRKPRAPVAKKVTPKNTESETPAANGSMADRLLAKFPNFDPAWSAELQAKWFAGFDALMAHAGIKEKK